MIINNQLSGLHKATASVKPNTTTLAQFTSLKATPKYYYISARAFTFPSSGYTRIVVCGRGATDSSSNNHLYAVNKNGRIFNSDGGFSSTLTSATTLTLSISDSTYGGFYTSVYYDLVYWY